MGALPSVRGAGQAWLFEGDDDLAEAFLAEPDTIQHLAGNAVASRAVARGGGRAP